MVTHEGLCVKILITLLYYDNDHFSSACRHSDRYMDEWNSTRKDACLEKFAVVLINLI